MLGAIVGAAVSRGLSPEALESWGWRVPFILGLIIGPVGLYIQRNMMDTEAFLHAQKTARRATLGEVFGSHMREVLCGLGSVIALTVTVYVLIAYLPTFAVKQLKLSFGPSFTALIVGNLLLTVLSLVAGACSDRIGRKGLVIWSLAITLVIIYPLFAWLFAWLAAEPSVGRLIVVQALLSIALSGYWGPFGALIAELFPAHVCSTGLSIAYNIAVMIFGGFGKFIVTWLIRVSGSQLAPTFYVMVGTSCCR